MNLNELAVRVRLRYRSSHVFDAFEMKFDGFLNKLQHLLKSKISTTPIFQPYAPSIHYNGLSDLKAGVSKKQTMECNGCEFRPDLYYDAEYQIWVKREADENFLVGMTDLSQTIAGKILHVRVRKPGTLRPKGKPVATIESGKWAGPIPNVFDCTIVAANLQVLDDPNLLNITPYEAWVARVKPTNTPEDALSTLLTGAAAQAGYCERCKKDDIHCERGVG